jgi:hypothetical protein
MALPALVYCEGEPGGRPAEGNSPALVEATAGPDRSGIPSLHVYLRFRALQTALCVCGVPGVVQAAPADCCCSAPLSAMRYTDVVCGA